MGEFLRTKAALGNSFDSVTMKIGHSKKAWRQVREVLPAGGTIEGVKELFGKGVEVIKAASPVKFDDVNNTITLVSEEDVKKATDAASIAALGINGFLYRDIPLESENTIATGDVVVNGDIYDFRFSAEIAKVLKQIPQPNGMKIRIVHM